MEHKPFNRNFWYALVAVLFAGGLILGQVYGLNDTLDENSGELAAQAANASEFIELRHIDVEIRQLMQETLEDDFSEVDEALGDL